MIELRGVVHVRVPKRGDALSNPTAVLRNSAYSDGRSAMARKCALVSSGMRCFLNACL